MSERLSAPSPEAPRKHIENSPEHHRPAHHKVEREQTAQEKQENITGLRQEVKKEAQSTGDIKLDHNSESNNAPVVPVNRELKDMMRIRILNRVRKDLPAPQRALSKVVHAKPVEAVSAVGEKTIARPAGLLGGGLFALVGSLITFYTAKHYGFRYNLLLFFLLFVAGYALATIIELVVLLVKRAR